MILLFDDVIIIGYIWDILEYFNSCKIFVVFLRYGVGIKGKILISFSYGLLVVVIIIVVEGMGI